MYFQKVPVISKKNFEKNFLASCQPLTKKTRSGSVSQWYESADTDPYQNVTDPQNCFWFISILQMSAAP
jgi:hypothetical protein